MKEYIYGTAKNFSIPEIKELISIKKEDIEAISDTLQFMELELEELENELKDLEE